MIQVGSKAGNLKGGENMLFIDLLIQTRNKIITKLKALKSNHQVNTNEFVKLRLMLDYINQMRNYIIKEKWIDKKTKDQFIYWIDVNGDHRKTAAHFNIKEDDVKATVTRANKKLKKIMLHPLWLISTGQVTEGYIEYLINIQCYSEGNKLRKEGNNRSRRGI